jgi:hypothetical protein
MRKPRSLSASVLFLVALSVSSITGGAEGDRLKILTDGRAYPGYRDLFRPGAAICVFEDSSYPSQSIQLQLVKKLSRLLNQKGYRLKSVNEADLCVVLQFGTDKFERQVTALPDNRIPSYIHYVVIKTFDAASYRDTGEMHMVWEGGSKYVDRALKEPEQPLELLDLLLVAAVDRFGKKGSLTARLRLDDPRAVALRQPLNKGL